jgi:hypothetical protein
MPIQKYFDEASQTWKAVDSGAINDGINKYTPADIKLIDEQLAEKAQQNVVDNIQSDITTNYAKKAEINTLASGKADIGYVDTKVAAVASGSPKGTYTTLSALQTAFPTGNTNIYVVTADGKWYYWNSSAWTAGGTYQSTGLANKSVTEYKVPEKAINDYHLKFLKTGKNLFNKELVVKDTYIKTDGTNGVLAGYATSVDIPVKAGVTYAIQKARYIATYDNNLTLIDRVDQGASTTTLIKTPTVDGYLRITTYDGTTGKYYLDSVQIEQNNVATSYEPYNIDFTQIANVAANKLTGQISYEQTNFIETGKNLFDESKKTSGGYLAETNGAWYDLETYSTSDFIPVVAGKTYYINKCNKFIVYNVFKGFSTGVELSATPYTFTAVENGYIRFSYLNTLTNIQFEEGNVETVYEPFKIIVPKLETQNLNTKPLTLIKSGNNFTIQSSLDNGDSIQVNTVKNGSSNGSFNFNNTYINGNLIHQTTDDITPIRTFTTVGANHGYTWNKITMISHGKTTADLGSRWTDGTNTYTLLDIVGNDLKLGMQYTTDVDGISTVTNVLPSTTLTHVSGAINTANIDVTSKVSEQMYPSVNNISVRYVLDGFELTQDGTYYGDELQVQESYNVMDYKSIIDYAQANIGQSYKNDSISGVVKLSINYTFSKGCNCLISHSIKALKKVALGACGFLQSVALGLSGHTLKRYMPNVLAKSGIDFKNIADMTSYSTTLQFSNGDLINPSKPPNRYSDWLFDGSNNKKYGFSMGYVTDKTNSKDADRLSQVNGYYWDMRSTKKSYPTAILNQTLNAGDYKTFLGYRSYLTPTVATNVNVVKDKKDAYVFIDYHQNVNGGNVKLNDFIGKTITVVDSENYTLLNDVVDADGVTFNISNNYGYAILKLT